MKYKEFIYTIIFILAMLLLAGCQHNTIEEYTDKEGNQVIREWYNKSHIKSIKTFTNPEKTNFRYVLFYKDGLLKDSAMYVNGKIIGLRKYFEASSGLLHLESYKNGILNGPQKAVFSSGISSFEGYRKDNQKVGEWKFFYPNGKPITYEYYDSTGRLKYFKKYDQNGANLKTDGTGLIEVVILQSDFKIQEPVVGYAIVALPDGCSLRLTIKDVAENVNAQPFFDQQIVESPVPWQKMFSTSGEKKLQFTLTITNNQTGEVEQSVFDQSINVESNL